MVGAGEVDEDLEVETKEECEKYGKVGKCVIFEVRGLSGFTQQFLQWRQTALCLIPMAGRSGRSWQWHHPHVTV